MDPLFEEYPWLLAPIVIAIVEVCSLTKSAVARRWRTGRGTNDVRPA